MFVGKTSAGTRIIRSDYSGNPAEGEGAPRFACGELAACGHTTLPHAGEPSPAAPHPASRLTTTSDYYFYYYCYFSFFYSPCEIASLHFIPPPACCRFKHLSREDGRGAEPARPFLPPLTALKNPPMNRKRQLLLSIIFTHFPPSREAGLRLLFPTQPQHLCGGRGSPAAWGWIPAPAWVREHPQLRGMLRGDIPAGRAGGGAAGLGLHFIQLNLSKKSWGFRVLVFFLEQSTEGNWSFSPPLLSRTWRW